MRSFEAAPWTGALRAVSAISAVVLFGVTVALYKAIPRGTSAPFAEVFGTLLLGVPLLTLAVAVLFVVTGYRIEPGCLHVRRLLWTTQVRLEGLDRAWHDPTAMCKSLRLVGNGGLFSVTGWFWNSRLGRYRAFVTDHRRAVVLQCRSGVVVISPADPQALLAHLSKTVPGITPSFSSPARP